ncbi:hypothetical protein [Burkholderia savannae]|uniref:hypothetical protein n=1 Tax=Burkholderia savannae TaxID=1637837 RepID=UPI0012E3EE03|nr:hypothetical protein [Burkholderia savannae]
MVKLQFRADRPGALWVASFYLPDVGGLRVQVLVTDVFAWRIVGWRVSSPMRTDFVLDALNQALHKRQPEPSLMHHSGQGRNI